MKVDFIVVGQGLAGTLLAHKLISLGKSVVVFDDPGQVKASNVAAGLLNPIGFKRMNKSWLVDEALAEMESTYSDLEKLLSEQLYFPGKIVRILSEDNAIHWQEKVFANQLFDYTNVEISYLSRKYITSQNGFGVVKKAGRVDLQKLTSSYSKFLIKQQLFRNEKFKFDELQLSSELVIYKDLNAEKIIFCEGAAASRNPYFENLKFKHSKGEILELKIPDLNLEEIVSSEVFVMPVGKDRYKVGATYSWEILDEQTTETARTELLDKLHHFISAKSEVLNQKAGIRPTMHDRKPVIGLHPHFPQIGIFNGLGPKGALLGPYFAGQFAQFLCNPSSPIVSEAHIKRYFRS